MKISRFFSHSDQNNILLLVIVNFIANFIFISKYTWYSDDWSAIVTSPFSNTSYLTPLLDAQRPLLYATDKFVSSLHPDALSLQAGGFLLSSLFLVITYLIIRKAATDFGYDSLSFPLLVCLFYVVLFNKDEIYPWLIVSTCNMAGYILYAVSILAFLYREKRQYLLLSLLTFFLGLLTYEIGFALVVFYPVYAFLTRSRVRYSLLFGVPLVLVLVIRYTEWFGFGSVYISRDVNVLDPSLFLLKGALFLFTSVLIISNQVQFSLAGWNQMGLPLVTAVLIVDLVLTGIIARYLSTIRFHEEQSVRLVILLLAGLVCFSIPYILTTGGTPTRGYIFIDLFAAALIVYGLVRMDGGRFVRLLYLSLVIFSIIMCQGLFMNWVVSGGITDDIAAYICAEEPAISSCSHVYFNSTSFTGEKPNSLATAYHPTRKDLFRLKRDFLGTGADAIITRIGTDDTPSRIDDGYEQYYNAKCLDIWALIAMLERCGIQGKTLVYGGNWYGNFPTGINSTHLRYRYYEDNLPVSGEFQISRSQVFEITYDNVTRFHDGS